MEERKTLLRVLIPQFEYEVVKLNEHEPAVLMKTNRLKRTKRGTLMEGGCIHDSLFQYNHFCYDPAIYHSHKQNYRRREEFMVSDWTKEL